MADKDYLRKVILLNAVGFKKYRVAPEVVGKGTGKALRAKNPKRKFTRGQKAFITREFNKRFKSRGVEKRVEESVKEKSRANVIYPEGKALYIRGTPSSKVRRWQDGSTFTVSLADGSLKLYRDINDPRPLPEGVGKRRLVRISYVTASGGELMRGFVSEKTARNYIEKYKQIDDELGDNFIKYKVGTYV